MPQIPIAFKAQKNLQFTLGTDTYEMHVSSIDWTPASSAVQWQGGTPDASFTDSSAPTWTANVTGAQDWETPDSLANFLLEHAGEQIPAKYKPDAAGDFEISATITIVPPKIGGAVGAFPEFTVAMGSTKPVVTPLIP